MEDMLQGEGAQTEIAENGLRAVERLRARPQAFDLVLMDIQMPLMDGYEATRLMKELAPDLPIIGQTAHAMAEDRARCLNAGMLDALTKPIDLDELITMILHYVPPDADAPTGEPTPATPPAQTTSAIKWPEFEARYADKPAFIIRLLTLFLNSNSGLPAQLRNAMSQGNAQGLAGLIHGLKGTSGSIMALDLMASASAAEYAIQHRHPDENQRILQLAHQLELTLEEIRLRLER